MKKILIVGLILAMIMSLPVVAFAAEERNTNMEFNDSLTISDEVRQQLNVQTSESIYRIYNLSIYMAFSQINCVEELLEKDELILSEYYVIQTTEGTLSYRGVIDNKVVNFGDDVTINSTALKAFQNGDVAKKISSDIEIYETYYFSGETSYTGSAIYYKTNKGDYVYYNHYALGNGEYLFPVKDFCDYQRAVYDELVKHANLDGGVDIGSIWNLSKYEINSPDFEIDTNSSRPDNSLQNNYPQNTVKWWVILFGVVLVSVVGTILGVCYYKRKT